MKPASIVSAMGLEIRFANGNNVTNAGNIQLAFICPVMRIAPPNAAKKAVEITIGNVQHSD
ncbi:MAG: hypothetical protein R3C26_14655 [Calditrichia bacterium]